MIAISIPSCMVCGVPLLMDYNGQPSSKYWLGKDANIVYCSALCGLKHYESNRRMIVESE